MTPLARALMALEQSADALDDGLRRHHNLMQHAEGPERCADEVCATTRAAMQYARATATELREELPAEQVTA